MTTRDTRWPSDLDEEAERGPDQTHTSATALRIPARKQRASPGRALETVLLASTAALVAAVAWPIATQSHAAPLSPAAAFTPPSAKASAPRIQLALLLDTSSSMDGLIDQARAQLWSVVNTLDGATFSGEAPRLEIAVYEYGNDRLASRDGYIRQVVAFSSELDRVSEGLFSLTTAGGDEYAGQAIGRAVDELAWAKDDNVFRVLYIAGNEGFDQGSVDFRRTVARAKAEGIVVNTVNCAGGSSWDAGWQEAADVGGGKALRIDQNAVAVHIESPYDAKIQALSSKINDTYIGYGSLGATGLANQAAQDANSVRYGAGSSISRAAAKSSMHYDNGSWDLVDALENGDVEDASEVRDSLAGDLKGLDDEALREHVEQKKAERETLQEEMRELQQKRADYVSGKKSDEANRLDTAIVESLTEQAVAAGFTL
ncbi:MAG: vWA domain-containing protein [Myxococcota bacterium]